MTQTKARTSNRSAGDDERLNEEFHTLLRDAACKREERALVQSTEDAAAAKQESADLLALARSQDFSRASRATDNP